MVIDSFDHGVNGRVNAGLSTVNDDGSLLNITDASFDSEDTQTWGYTQPKRRVWGLAVNKGRLYYTTQDEPQVWSIGVLNDGRFASDAKLEFDVKGLSGNGPITDMLFDKSGRLYLAQRGLQKASFNFTEFAEHGQASVQRYKPSTTSENHWEPDPDYYAIGMQPDHDAANGGIAIGPNQAGKCGETLWSTGGRLVSSDTPSDVHGLQGNALGMIRPNNVPPFASYFVDYDGQVGDAQNAGHMGDVAIFQPCVQKAELQYPPNYFPLDDSLPPEFRPPEIPYNTNLRLTKTASPKDCQALFGGWSCQFKIRVRNTGPDAYFGDIMVKDTVPAGAFFGVGPVPPWLCWSTNPSALRCWRPHVLVNPGQYVELKVNVWLPQSYDRCRLRNIAEIEWAPGGTQWNTDPTDDRDGASARVPLEKCLSVHRPKGSIVHRPKGSRVHRPKGSIIVHRPKGSRVNLPKGSRVLRNPNLQIR